MVHMGTELGQAGAARVDWVDYAKGFCIVMVVMMHSTLGVEAAAGETSWMHVLVAFAKPFRMPVFFVVTKLTRGVPVLVIWTILAALEISHIKTDWTVIDEFAARFVYFYTGYILAPRIFQIAAAVQARPALAAYALIGWALLNGFYVFSGLADKPFVSLTLGLVGAAAVVSISALIAKRDMFGPLRYSG